MKKFICSILVLLLIISAKPSQAEDVKLIGDYYGAKLIEKKELDFSAFGFMIFPESYGKDSKGSPNKYVSNIQAIPKTGEFYGFYYQMPPSMDETQTYYVVKKKLEDMGYKVVSHCTHIDCQDVTGFIQPHISKHYSNSFFDGMAQKGLGKTGVNSFLGSSFRQQKIYSVSSFVAHKLTEDEDTWVSFASFTCEKKAQDECSNAFGYAIIQTVKTPDKISTFTSKTFSSGDIKDQLEKEGKVVLHNILFDFGKATLKLESQEQLAAIEKYLKANPEIKMIVVGHTDNVGGFDMNMELSKNRADAVVKGLVKVHGIDANRLKAFGSGITSPVSSNNTEEGRAKNRRVELINWDGK
jgi:outer membrane protein OmpA-like peptidoglycan-associated protein